MVCWSQRPTLNLELVDSLDWRANDLQGASPPHYFPPWITDMTAWLHLAFYVGAGDPLSGPYVFVAST